MLPKKFNPLRTSCQNADPPIPTYYVYSSPPQPVWGRPIYRNNVARPRGVHDYYNVMWDPRVRRGDTAKRDEEKQQMRKCLTGPPGPRKKRKEKQSAHHHEVKRVETPPLKGHRNFISQTDTHLENLVGEVLRYDVQIQTEALHELPIEPWFIPSKIGSDMSTQIEPGDLFDFDLEVKPMVETLVGKVVEQALLEVMEEEELLALKDQQEEFEARRRLEQARLDRLREREERVHAERERLLEEERRRLREEKETEDIVAARAFASLYLANATRHTADSLQRDGYLHSQAIISNSFIPWLNCTVEHVLAKENLTRALIDDMIQNVVTTREAEYNNIAYNAEYPEPSAFTPGYLFPEDEP